MYSKFITVVFVLTLTSCKCGLLNWFTEWTDELEQQYVDEKCRQKREANEHIVTPKLTRSPSNKMVSLMDIEEERLPDQIKKRTETMNPEYSKTKRCPKAGYVGSIRNPILQASLKLDPLPLVKRQSEDHTNRMCLSCRAKPMCKLLRKCDECNKYCKDEATFTPSESQTVGITNRMAEFKNNNLLSKISYPVSTYKDGEMKDIICRLVGIADTSDIETVTVWVTTFSNNPPKSPGARAESSNKNSRKEDNLPESKLQDIEQTQKSPNKSLSNMSRKSSEMPMHGIAKPQPDLKPRFNDYDEDEDFPQTRNFEKEIRKNPDLIEGPPSFLGSKKEHKIITQPKEFVSEESVEDKSLPEVKPLQTEDSTSNNIPRANTFSTLKELRKIGTAGNIPSQRGFLQKLLRSDHDASENRNNITPQTSTLNDDQSTPIQIPKSNDKMSEINEALEGVKFMVKNMQKEAQEESEKRLLAASHIKEIPEDSIQKDAVSTEPIKIPTEPVNSVVPPRIVDKFKKVNKYLIDRAQDALDTIGHQRNEQKNQPLNSKESTQNDHSHLTKKLITDFKEMPQFLLNNFKDTFNEFDEKPESSPTDLRTENVKQIEKTERLGDFSETNSDIKTFERDNDENPEFKEVPLVGSPDQTIVDEEIPSTTKIYKNKLEKYLAELKDKRHKIYSPEKYQKGVAIETEESSKPIENFESRINLRQPLNQNSKTDTENILQPTYELQKQRDLLKDKLKNYINEVSKKINPITGLQPIAETKELMKNSKQEISHNPSDVLKSQKQPDLLQLQDITVEKPDQNLGEPHLIDELNSNDVNHFLPTLPTISNSGLKQIPEKPNKFMKYLEDLRTKKPFTSTSEPIFSTLSDIIPKYKNNVAEGNQLLNEIEPKKSLLKDKIKQYVDNLKKPEDVSKSYPTLNSRAHEDLPQFIDLDKNIKAKNMLDSATSDLKKNLLKNKLKNYVELLNKPVENRMAQPSDSNKIATFIRKSSDVRKEELNALKRKLENLLKAEVPRPSQLPTNNLLSNSIIGKTAPNLENPDTLSITNGKDLQDDDIIGEARTINDSIKQKEISTPFRNEMEIDLQERGNFNVDEDLIDWSSNLGKIAQSSPKDIFFIGNGIKLPLQLNRKTDGSIDLSVDLEKLCSCYNSTCPKNHTAIEETVGAILEKEAELQNQLTEPSETNSQNSPVFNHNPFKRTVTGINSQNKKTTIFKRSSEINPVLTSRMGNDLIQNYLSNNVEHPKLSSVQRITTDLKDIGKKLQETFTNSIQKLQNNVQELNRDVVNSIDSNKHTNAPLIGSFPKETFSPEKLKKTIGNLNAMNSDVLRKIEHGQNINRLLKNNKINMPYKNPNINMNEFIKQLEREKSLQKLLLQTTPANVLKQIENKAQSVIKDIEKQRPLKDINKFNKLTNKLQESVRNTLPAIPTIQEINDNLVNMPADVYQYTKINVLENKLRKLNDEVEKHEKDNDELFAKETEKIFGNKKDKVVQEEIDIVGKILSWINGLSGSQKEK